MVTNRANRPAWAVPKGATEVTALAVSDSTTADTLLVAAAGVHLTAHTRPSENEKKQNDGPLSFILEREAKPLCTMNLISFLALHGREMWKGLA